MQKQLPITSCPVYCVTAGHESDRLVCQMFAQARDASDAMGLTPPVLGNGSIFKTLVHEGVPDIFLWVPAKAYARMTTESYDWIRANFSSKFKVAFAKEGLAPPAVHDLYSTQIAASEIFSNETQTIGCVVSAVEDGVYVFHHCAFEVSRFMNLPVLANVYSMPIANVNSPHLMYAPVTDRSVISKDYDILQRRRIDEQTLGNINYGRDKAFHVKPDGTIELCEVRRMVALWKEHGFKASGKRYKQKFKERGVTKKSVRHKPPGRMRVVKSPIKAVTKWLDITSLANSIGSGATLQNLGLIPQGDQQNQRIADFARLRKIFYNYSMYIANADIVTTVETKFYKWIVNTALATPLIANLLQNPAAANSLSHENFEYQQNYRLLWQRRYRAVGTATNPTTAANFGRNNQRIKIGGDPVQKFNPTSTGGSNQLYIMNISDSALTPFPILNYVVRVYFEDTEDPHQKDNRMV
jgi:hypothetical protein